MKKSLFSFILLIAMFMFAENIRSPKGISFNSPENWTLVNSDQKKEILDSIKKKGKYIDTESDAVFIINDKEFDDYTEVITLEVFPGSKGEPDLVTVEELKKELEGNLEQRGYIIKKSQHELQDFQDKKWIRSYFEFINPSSDKELALEQIHIHGKNQVYQFSFICKSIEYAYYKTFFNQVKESIQVKKMYSTDTENRKSRLLSIGGFLLGLLIAVLFFMLIWRKVRKTD